MLYNTASETIKKYNMLKTGDRIVLGISGGADSSALLNFIAGLREKYSLRLIVVHINHMLRGTDADSDSEFVSEMCRRLNVEFRAINCDVEALSKEMKISLEEAGRMARYSEFYKAAAEEYGSKIAVAHNLNDNAETVIMRLARGTGLKGMGGILPVRENIIRPLIECTRGEIEEYCVKNGIDFRTDSTNTEDIYTRNKIRLAVIPALEQGVNSNVVANIGKASKMFRDEEQYLERVAEEGLNSLILRRKEKSIYISTKGLQKYDDVIKRRIIRLSMRNINTGIKDVSFDNVDKVLELVNGGTGKKVNLALGFRAEKQYDELKISHGDEKTKYGFQYNLKQEKFYIEEIKKYIKINVIENKDKLPKQNVYRKVFDYNKVFNGQEVLVRTRKTGDEIVIDKSGSKKKLKDYFIDEKVPREIRDLIPVVASGSDVIWIVGYRYSSLFGTDEKTKKFLVIEFLED